MREILANQQVPTMDRLFSDFLVPCTAPTLHHYLLFGTINKIGTSFYAAKVYYNVKNVDTWVQIVFQSCWWLSLPDDGVLGAEVRRDTGTCRAEQTARR